MVSLTSLVILALAISMTSCQQVQIFMSGKDLPDMDPIINVGPDALVYVLFAESDSTYVELGQTADISDNNNPDWPERFAMYYTGGRTQMVKLDVWDADSPDSDDDMGYVEFPLGDIVNVFGNKLELNITSGNPGGGSIIITAIVGKIVE